MAADTNRANKIRVAIRYLLENDKLQDGDLTKLATHFNCTRERVRQLKEETIRRMEHERIAALRPVIRKLEVAHA